MKNTNRLYWPSALALVKSDIHGYRIERLFTYDACHSIDMAKKGIDDWIRSGHYILLTSWITHDWDHKKVSFNVYEDNIRTLEWEGDKIYGKQ